MIRCQKAKPGWQCTRDAGHDGPCAAERTLPVTEQKLVFIPAFGVETDLCEGLLQAGWFIRTIATSSSGVFVLLERLRRDDQENA
jgi:hypothetical protein